MPIEKPWGTTECLLQTPLVEVHRIKVNEYSYCSWHKHEHKWNAFYVIDGVLRIEFDNSYNNYNLANGGFIAVKPGEYHRFVSSWGPVTALEIYYPDILGEDIIRRDVGGCLTAKELFGDEKWVQSARTLAAVLGAEREGRTRIKESWSRPSRHAQGGHQSQDENREYQKGQSVLTGAQIDQAMLRCVWADPEEK